MKRYFPILLLVVIAFYVWDQQHNVAPPIYEVEGGSDYEVAGRGEHQVPGRNDSADSRVVGASDRALANAFRNRTSNLQIEGVGKVVKVLRDDNDGSRHQRFILELGSGQTLLVAHNIDLAPRIPSLEEGDTVAFYGEYEWNSRGGVLHWTHHDPGGRHVDGWLRHRSQMYR